MYIRSWTHLIELLAGKEESERHIRNCKFSELTEEQTQRLAMETVLDNCSDDIRRSLRHSTPVMIDLFFEHLDKLPKEEADKAADAIAEWAMPGITKDKK